MNIRIKDICRFGKKSDIKAGEGNTKGKYMFFTSSIDKDKRIDKFDYDEEGIIMGTGGNATLHYYSGKFAVSTDCLVLLPNSSYKCKYLYYFFLHNMRVLEGGFRGAGLKHTSKSYIENIELTKTHSLLEQDKIISVLSNIDNTIVLQNKRLKLINELTSSLFIEMFGDISDQDKVEVSRICKLITDGTHQPPKFEERGIPFLFVSNIVTNNITYDTEKFISEETYKELIKRTPIEIGDLLLSTVGSYGHAAIVKFTKRFCFQRHIAYLKPKSKIVDSEYFRSAILSDNVQRQIHLGVKGIAQKTLNLSEIRKLRIPLPPMVQQQQFAKVVIEIDKSKLAVKKSLEELEILKKSLMQKYFA